MAFLRSADRGDLEALHSRKRPKNAENREKRGSGAGASYPWLSRVFPPIGLAGSCRLMQLLPVILAQTRGTSTDIGAQARAFLDLLLTPAGFALTFFGIATIGVLLVSRVGTQIVAAFMIFMLSMMRTDSKWSDNTLVQPLETLRNFSRPLALGLLVVLAIRTLAFPRMHRRRMFIAPAAMFLTYQLLFIGMIGLFIDPVRGAFGVVCYLATIAVFAFGLPSLMQDEEDSQGFLKVFAMAGLFFIAANLLQLTGGYYNAVLQGRLAGVAGNAQQMSVTCCAFIAVGCFFFSTGQTGSWTKWIAGVALGILGLFILWSGSRTGAICTAIIVFGFFRARVGRLALLGVIGGAAFAVAIAVFSESLDIVERFVRGSDTRSEVWQSAVVDFIDSPLFGQIPLTKDDGLNFVESTYLRTLALMGILGGAVLAALMYSWVLYAVRIWRMGRAVPSLAPHADFVVAGTAFFVVVNISEGLMMGVLTLFVPFIYAIFSSGAFVLDMGQQELDWREEQGIDGDAYAGDASDYDGDDGDHDGNHQVGHGPANAEGGWVHQSAPVADASKQ